MKNIGHAKLVNLIDAKRASAKHDKPTAKIIEKEIAKRLRVFTHFVTGADVRDIAAQEKMAEGEVEQLLRDFVSTADFQDYLDEPDAVEDEEPGAPPGPPA